jgi:hypothetical protein
MTQASETNYRDRSLDRQFRFLERRLTRLEDTHLTGVEVNLSFEHLYAEIDANEEQINRRFDRLEARLDRLEWRVEERFDRLERKLDLAIAKSPDKDRESGGD